MINKNRLVENFSSMARISSPSKQEGAFAAYAIKLLQDLGMEVETDDTGSKIAGQTGNIIARLKGSKDFFPVILSAHMDTVGPCDNIQPVINGDIIYSDGNTVLGADDKAGIAAIIEAITTARERNLPHGNIEVVLTACEETGMLGAKNLSVDKLDGELGFIFDCDGPPGTIISQGPAKDVIKALIKGKKAHAGLCPEEGISAIQVAAQAVTAMKLLRIDAETTANIGTLHGSTATNVVCDRVELLAEARSLYNEKLDLQTTHMKECLMNAAQKYKAEVEVDIERSYPSYKHNEKDLIIQLTKEAITGIGLEPIMIPTGGGSDANVLNGKGIPFVDLGIGMSQVHTTGEYIKIKDLCNTAKLILRVISLCKNK